ncbi:MULTISPECIES: single-stranded DNA-binding protein [Rathayibacter]|jgi:single-strand DNA-binding protein|uniref:Single-stranded DNA-binding protein n=1 Tax=Rathayibacter festucae DSM 15932 TaxID=1328866 RepID=A0A3T0T4E3_9MICO|nr:MULTISPECIES: single-stranded DNA-binding protein [Rathayibacter]AZZ53463.1 single-stranded DNA-binding protein [Rathayibacter festucae DSM 15932]MCJ1698316.1 single-stranded DNA-binding protein [Rathayibacter festucae]MCJ1705865.1 single-stranded DNA-binding protein [Rathayibacter sp. VKM Ac-2926]MDY0914700.1 single-stranded DNA-binding protein [Rathayibacter festucae]NQX17135.1 single-stranded DNA-binding protein [Rathayibacter sp. VKM Ac-2857]
MAGETIITVVGNLTADPELRYTQGGLAVANFTIASTPRTFDRQANDWKDGEALFLRASVWREFAENVAGTLTKGSRVVATGRLKQRSYETKEGEKRTSIELEIDEIGPSLRYATAQVTRAAGGGGGRGQVGGGGGGNQGASQGGFGGGNGGNQGGSGGNGGGNRGGGQAEEPWAPSAPAGGDVWSTPGSYNDETPF